MNDWITHNFAAFWLVLIGFGMVIGGLFLSDAYGIFGGVVAGAVGGAGCALILSANRYIGGADREDDGPRG
jgi:hypothetical protein